jgi:hypothetical protein
LQFTQNIAVDGIEARHGLLLHGMSAHETLLPARSGFVRRFRVSCR